ncbi:MAG: hypothetical protein HND48_21125 [Chloroflexi bacterium]|nr:hypothetical protein [Chloroflexota bacterium]
MDGNSVDVSPEQTELLRAAQAGDPQAFESLYLALEPDVSRFVRRLLRDDPICDDVVQGDPAGAVYPSGRDRPAGQAAALRLSRGAQRLLRRDAPVGTSARRLDGRRWRRGSCRV